MVPFVPSWENLWGSAFVTHSSPLLFAHKLLLQADGGILGECFSSSSS